MNSRPARVATDKHISDQVVLWRESSRNKIDEFRMDADRFIELWGNGGGSPGLCDNVCSTESGDNYEMYKTEYPNGEFDIKLKYRVACDSNFTVDLFDSEPAMMRFDEALDHVVSDSTLTKYDYQLQIPDAFNVGEEFGLVIIYQNTSVPVSNISYTSQVGDTQADVYSELRTQLIAEGFEAEPYFNARINDDVLIFGKNELVRRINTTPLYTFSAPGGLPIEGTKYGVKMTVTKSNRDVEFYNYIYTATAGLTDWVLVFQSIANDINTESKFVATTTPTSITIENGGQFDDILFINRSDPYNLTIDNAVSALNTLTWEVLPFTTETTPKWTISRFFTNTNQLIGDIRVGESIRGEYEIIQNDIYQGQLYTEEGKSSLIDLTSSGVTFELEGDYLCNSIFDNGGEVWRMLTLRGTKLRDEL